MALTLTKNAPNFPFQVIAQGEAGLGAPMPNGCLGKVTAEPAGIAVVSLDPSPVAVANPYDPASGTKSVISGVANPAAVGKTTVTASILDSDGSTLTEVTDAITVVEPGPGVAAWAGTLFGATTPIALPAPGTASKTAKSSETAPAHHNPGVHSHEEEKKRK